MEAHSISVTVGNIVQDFISDLKYCHQTITVNYSAKKRPYGSKVVISAKNNITGKSILYSLVKIRSLEELHCLRNIITGIQSALDHYYSISCETNSD